MHYTIGDATVVAEKAVEARKPRTVNSCWQKSVPSRCEWRHKIYNRAYQGNHERVYGYSKKRWCVKSSRYGSWGNSRANRHHVRGINRKQLAGDERFWRQRRSARKQIDVWWPGRGFQLFKTASEFLYDLDPSMIWALKLEKMWKKDWYHIETF